MLRGHAFLASRRTFSSLTSERSLSLSSLGLYLGLVLSLGLGLGLCFGLGLGLGLGLSFGLGLDLGLGRVLAARLSLPRFVPNSTKIVATIGPASEEKQTLQCLISAGLCLALSCLALSCLFKTKE